MLTAVAYMNPLLGFNKIRKMHDFDVTKEPGFSVLGYNQDYTFNVNFMVLFQGLALIMYLVYFIAYKRVVNKCKKYGKNP